MSKLIQLLIFAWACLISAKGEQQNLTCYQCTKQTTEECGPETLLPCPPVSDRCVTHITQDAQRGFTIKRECGLGPCGFDDAMMNKGLGLDGCDRSKDEYFCIFCCRTSGCNKSSTYPTRHLTSPLTILSSILLLCLIKNRQG